MSGNVFAADFDAYGVPEFYMNVPVAEQAGGGNIRIWNCVIKHGVLVPVCAVIIPAVQLVTASRIVREAAEEAFRLEREMALH